MENHLKNIVSDLKWMKKKKKINNNESAKLRKNRNICDKHNVHGAQVNIFS